MVKLLRHIGLILVICTCITILFGYWLWLDYFKQRNHVLLIATRSFAEVVKLEKKEKLDHVPQYSEYDSRISPNNIPYEEKKNWCDQSYITKRDQNRTMLDSLFRARLAKDGVRGQTAVRCLLRGNVTYSSDDIAFYEKSNFITSIIYRFNEKPEGRFELQAYVKFSFWSVLKKVDSIEIIISFWLLSLAILIGGHIYLRRKGIGYGKKSYKRIQKEDIITQYQMDYEWLQLTDDLLYNKRLGVLKYKGATTTLIGNALKLFNMFLNAPNNSLTYNDISVRLLHRSPVELSKSDLSAVFSTVKRFRDDLTAVPNVQIELLRRKGYQMFIFTDKELEEWKLAKLKAKEEKQDDLKSDEATSEESKQEESDLEESVSETPESEVPQTETINIEAQANETLNSTVPKPEEKKEPEA